MRTPSNLGVEKVADGPEVGVVERRLHPLGDVARAQLLQGDPN
jgi:hypothetical protein